MQIIYDGFNKNGVLKSSTYLESIGSKGFFSTLAFTFKIEGALLSIKYCDDLFIESTR
jgi:hypothetical protein